MEKNTNSQYCNSKDIWKNYGLLRYIMKICGIDLNNKKTYTYLKVFKYLYPSLMHFMFIYFICVYPLVTAFSTSYYIEIMAGIIFSIVVWHLLIWKVKHLKQLLLKMKMWQLHKQLGATQIKIANVLLLIIILLPIITVLMNVYYVEYDTELQQKLFTFNTVFESNCIKILSRLLVFTSYFTTLYQFPMIGTVFCCLMYYQLSKNISHFCKESISQFDQHLNSPYIMKIFHRLSRLVDLSITLDEILSPISFYLLSLQVVILFSTVATLVEMKFSNMNITHFLEYIMATVISLTAIFSINISASLIEKQFLHIKRNLTYMHEMYVHFTRRDNFTLEMIRYMISMELPVMTAWSMIALRPSLIFSIISVCLSFGLLSTQILH